MKNNLQDLRNYPHWSFSSLNCFLNICSLQWGFKYFYKKEPETPKPKSLLLGTAFHQAASWIALSRKKSEYLENESEQAQEVFSEVLNLELKEENNASLSNDEVKDLFTKGKQMVDCLSRQWLEDNVISVGQTFSVLIPGTSVPLIGEIDLVVRDDNDRTVLVDWKTSERKWSKDKAHKDLQATCFLYAYEQIYPEFYTSENLFRYDVITKTKVPSYIQNPTSRSKDQFNRLGYLIKNVEEAIKNEIFLPNENSFFCNNCRYKSSCKEWHRKQASTVSTSFQAA